MSMTLNNNRKAMIGFGLMALAIFWVGQAQSWSLALTIVNYGVIAAIMALGLNIQWGYAGLFNVGVMGFAALGGLAAILVSMPPTLEAWDVGGEGILAALGLALLTTLTAIVAYKLLPAGRLRRLLMTLIIVVGFFLSRLYFLPAVALIEQVNPAQTGYLGGAGLPILLSWVVGGCFAAAAAWLIGKITLGLRADYLAIATLGISEIVLAILRYEEWLTRGVNNVNGIPRPVPFEIDIQTSDWGMRWAQTFGVNAQDFASIFVKLSYFGLSIVVLALVFWLSQRALQSPWGRMMRAIRDNETAAEAMGKDVKGRHLQVFVLGSAVIGIAGAMMVTLDGQFTPNSYNPLRFTFLIWVMVIVGGSGNNLGAILGGFLIWFFWVQAEPIGLWLMSTLTSFMSVDHALRIHLLDGAAHMRLLIMGLILLLALRFRPKGLLPEDNEAQRRAAASPIKPASSPASE
jgi:branched-chain amino acid transport system permease protein